MRRSGAVACLAVLAITTGAGGQYFGQNQVQYRDFDFSIIETEHFDVYYYDDFRAAAVDAAQMAERAYARLSRLLNHQYRERQPIILFASHSEFQQNNLHNIGEGVQGVTDPYRHRVMLPFTGSYEEFEHVLQHELVHQFQFDIFARGHVGAAIQRLLIVQPPLWVTEGMAEYLSVGPVDALTAMWIRDGAQHGTLPTIEALTTDPTIFPYRYGHAVFAFIAQRWGPEAVGEVFHAVTTSGLEAGVRRALRMSLSDLSAAWHADARETLLAEYDASREAGALGRPVLTRERSDGGFHVSPALAPDGSEVAYFSEGGSLSIDLYVADAETGRHKRRLVKSAFSAAFESLRFVASAGAWSADGRYFAFPAKRGGRDDLVIYDMRRRRVHRRIRVDVAGIENPSWAPDGSRIVFTGLAAGISDLYTIRVDGSDLVRLTSGPEADMHPAWSPDGRTIAFVTDRGASANFGDLRPAPLSIALYDLEMDRIDLLAGQTGHNINPQWSPEGHALAYVSDRTGVANVFLYEFDEGRTYQLTDVFTGIAGITGTSPAISWAPEADRLAVTYYEHGEYNVYAIDDPRALKGDPYRVAAPLVADDGATAASPPPPPEPPTPAAPPPPDLAALLRAQDVRQPASFYRGNRGFRPSSVVPAREQPARRPISVRALLDSTIQALPDPTSFGTRRYSPTLRVDYVVQPSVGYQRDNFGQGFYGGTAVAMSDLLGNRSLLLGGQVNGRIEEAQVVAMYVNRAHRTNWAAGYQQAPTFYFEGADISADSSDNALRLNQRVQRFIVHQAFFEATRPLSRFERFEARLTASNVASAELNFQTVYDPMTGFALRQDIEKTGRGSVNFLQPALAWVYDNTIPGRIGTLAGRRNRFEYAPAIGEWEFHQTLADYRRYDPLPGPFMLATRLFLFGRFGRDSDRFPVFVGSTDLIRGYTSGSFRRRECSAERTPGVGVCDELAQLIGSRLALFNAELRIPLVTTSELRSLPTGFPALEGALFFDGGVAWSEGNRLTWRRRDGDDLADVRAPLTSVGLSLRGNLLGFIILRGDFTKPLTRELAAPYWTVSLGPVF